METGVQLAIEGMENVIESPVDTSPLETVPDETVPVTSSEALPDETVPEETLPAETETETVTGLKEPETAENYLPGVDELEEIRAELAAETEISAEVLVPVVDAINAQTETIHAGFVGVNIMLGILCGIVLMLGFRLRRV